MTPDGQLCFRALVTSDRVLLCKVTMTGDIVDTREVEKEGCARGAETGSRMVGVVSQGFEVRERLVIKNGQGQIPRCSG
jgi:hypothetical protein